MNHGALLADRDRRGPLDATRGDLGPDRIIEWSTTLRHFDSSSLPGTDVGTDDDPGFRDVDVDLL
jgi:hypothetical protein